MPTFVKLIAVAAAVVLVVVVGYQFLPGYLGAGSQPTLDPTRLIGSGEFQVKGALVELHAFGGGDRVTGRMTVGENTTEVFTVDLNCTERTKDGRILIGGETIASTSPWTTKGLHTAIVFRPGPPRALATFAFEDVPSALSCTAYLDSIANQQFTIASGDGALEPIVVGTVELGP